MRHITITPFLALAALLATSACDGIVISERTAPRLTYFEGDFEYAIHKGAILTEVGAGPFKMPADRFEAMVRDYMRGANQGPEVDFAPKASDKTLLPYKVVAAFNPKVFYDGDDLCGGVKTLEAEPPSQRLRVVMAFCFGDAAKSVVVGTAPEVSGPDDPELRALIRQVTLYLVPTGPYQIRRSDRHDSILMP